MWAVHLNVFKHHLESVWLTIQCLKMCMFYNIREKPEKKLIGKKEN